MVNTGDIPLAEVKNRITDDTCSPVTYVSGDDDGNGLLTGELSIYEISTVAEVWVFECTRTVSVDTTNTVTVSGVPSDLRGNRLGPDVSARAVASVDVTGRLPSTGGDTGRILRIGALTIATGAALIALAWAARRRRAHAPHP